MTEATPEVRVSTLELFFGLGARPDRADHRATAIGAFGRTPTSEDS